MWLDATTRHGICCRMPPSAAQHRTIATISTVTRGNYSDDYAVVVTTTAADKHGSHGHVFEALKAAGIAPSRLSPGTFRLTYDPDDLDEKKAVKMVKDALRAAGILAFRRLPSGDVVEA